jgi:hypothetical protein
VNFKKSTMSEHVTHLETLREEINIMTEKKMDLERRIEVIPTLTHSHTASEPYMNTVLEEKNII